MVFLLTAVWQSVPGFMLCRWPWAPAESSSIPVTLFYLISIVLCLHSSWVNRKFSFQVSQISCYSTTLAPPGFYLIFTCFIIFLQSLLKWISPGCTQYYTGTSNSFNSYNYAGGVQLANQKQNICMRSVTYLMWCHGSKFKSLNFIFIFPGEREVTAGMEETSSEYSL